MISATQAERSDLSQRMLQYYSVYLLQPIVLLRVFARRSVRVEHDHMYGSDVERVEAGVFSDFAAESNDGGGKLSANARGGRGKQTILLPSNESSDGYHITE